MEKHLRTLITETRNNQSMNLDTASPMEVLKMMNDEDKKVAYAVETVLPEINKAVECAVDSFLKGGRLIYTGAGTSGRLGVLDAVECPPTFRTSPEQVRAVIAGGEGAFQRAVEGAEDSPEEGKKDLMSLNLSAADTVIGIAASGRTPYVAGALEYARKTGAHTVALSCNEGAFISGYADYKIEAVVGPEVLTGSTRLKAATAQKMILNMISTASMIRIGKVYENLMIDVHVSNNKLKERAISIIETVTGVSYEKAEKMLEKADNQVKKAIVMIKTNSDADSAQRLLERSSGNTRLAISSFEEKDVQL
ncbi:N-acetylmuramic acid 6-phosphate etherase [Bacillus sp. FJAT-42376]|uniref:N-acetylmuramic acid 6-phosphate etherase n=1 Tax=Bacillus sp. FJAT-42376 TaxID=2014076 RepID=UPI000F4E7EA6|nr:N-acetylmuramic acid 6-phosphate etherase [Bacillus sp. FJAT-42376]AZB43108.1 N-acetylmuramic acid 6-phosphate etherase [Bacillus sp. FJAT-42376]